MLSSAPVCQSSDIANRALRQKRRELTIDPDFSSNFSTEALNTALLAMKSEKAAGFHGVKKRTKESIVG
jgi:hypothetical protein